MPICMWNCTGAGVLPTTEKKTKKLIMSINTPLHFLRCFTLNYPQPFSAAGMTNSPQRVALSFSRYNLKVLNTGIYGLISKKSDSIISPYVT